MLFEHATPFQALQRVAQASRASPIATGFLAVAKTTFAFELVAHCLRQRTANLSFAVGRMLGAASRDEGLDVTSPSASRLGGFSQSAEESVRRRKELAQAACLDRRATSRRIRLE